MIRKIWFKYLFIKYKKHGHIVYEKQAKRDAWLIHNLPRFISKLLV